MSELAVRVEGLGKEYRLGAQPERYSTLRDRLNKLPSALFKALRGRGERSEQNPPFWALKDVSFEVRPGEVVGIIGRNGAGKSTLLKILSRITEPTEGEVDIKGRVGSLLEVGTGFHPELTGRENVYLNGAILGMRRAEIARKFDDIVGFAEVEKFIDTPVKHYSSGMYMRLAFAVAAHLEPEILVVDEVLAVGDAEFQKKCLGKMSDVAKGGRTVIFVSHNMGAVQTLCTRAVLLRAGQMVQDGPVGRVLTAYLADKSAELARRGKSSQPLDDGLTLERFVVTPAEPTCDDPISIEFEITSELDQTSLSHLCLILYTSYDVRVGIIDLRPRRPPYDIRFGRRLVVRCDLEPTRLVEGDYKFGLYISSAAVAVNVSDICPLVITTPALALGAASDSFVRYPAQHRGAVELAFTVSRLEAAN